MPAVITQWAASAGAAEETMGLQTKLKVNGRVIFTNRRAGSLIADGSSGASRRQRHLHVSSASDN
jgi:hypothetical protein